MSEQHLLDSRTKMSFECAINALVGDLDKLESKIGQLRRAKAVLEELRAREISVKPKRKYSRKTKATKHSIYKSGYIRKGGKIIKLDDSSLERD